MNKGQPTTMRKPSAWRWWYRGCLITFVFAVVGVCVLSSYGAVMLVRLGVS